MGKGRAFVDLTGQRFGRLAVEARAGSKWQCRCDCGTITIVEAGNLRNGNTKSCGCYNQELRKARGKAQSHGIALG